MPLKADVQRNFPQLESISANDMQKLMIFFSAQQDTMETISRRAQEAGQLAEEVKAQQQSLVNSLASPSITNNQDPTLGAIGNLSADLTAIIVGAVPVTGKVAIRDSNGNSVNILVG